MEVELVPLGAVPLGLVSSILLYGAGSGGEQAEVSACRRMKITCIASPVDQLSQTQSACEHRFPFCSSSLLFLFFLPLLLR